jgi:hypothetical protein
MDESLIHAIQDNLTLKFWPQREVKLLYGLLKRKPGLPHPPGYLVFFPGASLFRKQSTEKVSIAHFFL